MILEDDNVKITVEYDGDGFPEITIELNGFTGDHDRPTVDVTLDGVMIHEMFDEDDLRWTE
jgi:hypothetical protein